MYSPLQESETAVMVLDLSTNLLTAGLTAKERRFKIDGADSFAILDGGKQRDAEVSALENNMTAFCLQINRVPKILSYAVPCFPPRGPDISQTAAPVRRNHASGIRNDGWKAL